MLTPMSLASTELTGPRTTRGKGPRRSDFRADRMDFTMRRGRDRGSSQPSRSHSYPQLTSHFSARKGGYRLGIFTGPVPILHGGCMLLSALDSARNPISKAGLSSPLSLSLPLPIPGGPGRKDFLARPDPRSERLSGQDLPLPDHRGPRYAGESIPRKARTSSWPGLRPSRPAAEAPSLRWRHPVSRQNAGGED